MPELRIFVSSTCYDLSLLRSQLRIFIKNMGYTPVMSEYEDILYDPSIHTHTSCIDEVNNCDMLILIIGSRFGGKAIPEALNKINFEIFKDEKIDIESLKSNGNLSITQLEVLKAIEKSLPVYTFIDKQVLYDHKLYEKNKSTDIIDKIIFPSIEKQETAKFIFNFINFVRFRTKGNNIFTFEKCQDIEDILKKQWSSYFHKLLYQQKFIDKERKQTDVLGEQFENLKTAILSSITNSDQRIIAQSIVRYKNLVNFLVGIGHSINYLMLASDDYQVLLNKVNIKELLDIQKFNKSEMRCISFVTRTILIKEDNTFFESRLTIETINGLENDWMAFKELDISVKQITLEALQDMIQPNLIIRYRENNIKKLIKNCEEFHELQ